MKKYCVFLILLKLFFFTFCLEKDFFENYIQDFFNKYKVSCEIISDLKFYKEYFELQQKNIYKVTLKNNKDEYKFDFYEDGRLESYIVDYHHESKIGYGSPQFITKEQKKTIKSEKELIKIAEEIVKDIFYIDIGKVYKLHETKRNKKDYYPIDSWDFNKRIKSEYSYQMIFSKYVQGYPCKDNIIIELFLNGEIHFLSINDNYYPVMKKFNQTISREKATEIAKKTLKEKMPVFFEGKYFTYLGRTDTGEVNGYIWLDQTTNFKEPFIMYTDIDYMRDYNKSFIGKLWKKYFPRYPKLIWHINFKFKDERFYKIPGKNYDELMYPTVCVMVNAENGNVEHILPRVFSQFKDGKITSEGRFREE
ncbi:MAG: hypothetical protein M0R46_14300 [Candidatus Muirbacterium halophilum]|nr:hypothetical protein [Candidatus Muirbacterium halophilum]